MATTINEGNFLGFSYEVSKQDRGYHCGYVRIPEGHPWYGEHYNNLFTSEDFVVDVHGGLTFSAMDRETKEWIIGFDCAHYGDAPTPESEWEYGIYRSAEYVEAQCRHLCRQAKEVE